MKKVVSLLLVAVFVISMISAAFARPIIECPTCGKNMTFSYSAWVSKIDPHAFYYVTWEERTVTVKCSKHPQNKTTYTEKRNEQVHYYNTDWGLPGIY